MTYKIKKILIATVISLGFCLNAYAVENNFYGKSADGVIVYGFYYSEKDFWGGTMGISFNIKIKNSSNYPIELNPVADKVYLVSKEDKVYDCNIPSSYDMYTLNPDDDRDMRINTPKGSIKPEDVKFFKVLLNYGRVEVIMNPRPEMIEKFREKLKKK